MKNNYLTTATIILVWVGVGFAVYQLFFKKETTTKKQSEQKPSNTGVIVPTQQTYGEINLPQPNNPFNDRPGSSGSSGTIGGGSTPPLGPLNRPGSNTNGGRPINPGLSNLFGRSTPIVL